MKTFASSGAHSFRMLPGIPSGPVALFTFIACRSFRTPAFDTVMSGMGCLRLGSSSRGLGGSGVEKTLVKNLLNKFALGGVLDQGIP